MIRYLAYILQKKKGRAEKHIMEEKKGAIVAMNKNAV